MIFLFTIGIISAYFLQDYPFLVFIWLLPLFYIPIKFNFKKTLLYSLIYNFITNLFNIFWISNSIINYSSINEFLAYLITIFACLVFSLNVVIFPLLFKLLRKTNLDNIITVPLVYIFLQYAIPNIFKWHLGFHFYKYPLLYQFVDITGIYGLSFLIVMICYVLFDIMFTKKYIKFNVLVLAITLSVVTLYNNYRYEQINTKLNKVNNFSKIALVQPNLDYWSKLRIFKKGGFPLVRKLNFNIIKNLKNVDLIIYPETSMDKTFDNELLNYIKTKILNKHCKAFIAGVLTKKGDKYYNSCFYIDKKGNFYIYNKKNLVIAGEYLPILDIIYPKFYNKNFLHKGGSNNVIFFNDIVGNILPTICYDEIFTFDLLKNSNKSQIIVNVTNDSWFGKTKEPYQHLALAIFRAVEFRLPLVRATNTGITCYVNVLGNIIKRLPLFTRNYLIVKVEKIKFSTFYKNYGLILKTIVLVFSLLLLFIACVKYYFIYY